MSVYPGGDADRPPPDRFVLFDLDDTLVDHRAAATTASRHAIDRWSPEAQHAHDLDDLLALWERLEREEYDGYLRGACTHAEQRVRRLEQFLPVLGVDGGDADVLTAEFQHYLDAYVAAWAPFADVTASLDELEVAGIGGAVLTNGDPRQQRLKLERTGLVDRFDRILTPTEVGAPKPDPKHSRRRARCSGSIRPSERRTSATTSRSTRSERRQPASSASGSIASGRWDGAGGDRTDHLADGAACPALTGRLSRRLVGRNSLRQTSRSPDQVASIAHTLLSTRPSGRATSRTTSSVMSVATPELRFGQAIQSERSGKTACPSVVDLLLEGARAR